jgi:hypothetical protein
MFPRVTNPSAAPHRSEALDLHVLGVPPAFVLSQDQTLKLKSNCLLILDVRTSAHRPVVQTGQSSVCCASGFIETESRPNSEADTTSSDLNPSSAI